MTWPITFANLAAGPQPLADFDIMFNAVGAASIIACTATGSNTVVLTPKANYFTPVAYSDGGPMYTWVQQTTCTGAVTINAAGLGALAAYRNNGATQIAAGDLVAGQTYFACTQQSLNSGAGGFVVLVEQAQTPQVSAFGGGQSGTYTPPAGTRYLTVFGFGGGGGGAGSGSASGAGGNGGNTTFGAITASGGGGSPPGFAQGTGGGVTGAPIIWPGANGGLGTINGGQPGGAGGASGYGGGGAPGTAIISNGFAGNAPASNTGAGGGGASSGATANSGGGGGGAGAFYLLTTTLTPTAYSVGSAGAAGAAGTGGSVGGAGSSGLLWITAFF